MQGGDPIKKRGLVLLNNLITRLWTFGSERSHALPVLGSAMVKSRLQPGWRLMPSLSYSAAACAIRGLEYASDTSTSFLLYMLMAFFIVSSTLMSSGSFMTRLSM